MDPFNPTRRGVLAAAMVALVPGTLPFRGSAAAPSAFSLVFYRSGSGVPASVYADAARTRLHPNPLLVTDTSSAPPIFLDPLQTYRMVARDQDGTVIADEDPFTAIEMTQVLGCDARDRDLPPMTSVSWINLAEFGYAGDFDPMTGQGQDDTAAWRAAIAAAADRRIARIGVPWGSTGVSLVHGPIVDGPLPSGLIFESFGPASVTGVGGVTVLYSGKKTCWNVHFDGISGGHGRWTFRNLAFKTCHGSATVFDFNRAAEWRPVGDFDRFGYIEHVRFEGCYFEGPGLQSKAQIGDAIRAAKTFQLVIDENTFIRDFRRGVWLFGCDNCTIGPRAFLCAREIMIEHPPVSPPNTSPLGNDNRVTSRFNGGSPAAASETMYNVWDGCASTVIEHCLYEDNNGNRAAFLYLNGSNTMVVKPHFGGGRYFHLGPSATQVTLLLPSVTRFMKRDVPLIDPPLSWDFGYEQSDHRMLVIGASRNVQTAIGAHPRVLYSGRFPAKAADLNDPVPTDQSKPMLVDGRGYRPRQHLLSGLNFWARSVGTAATGGIGGIVPDKNASGGWTIRLDPAVSQGGLSIHLLLGRELMPGDIVRLIARVRSVDPSGWISTVTGGNSEPQPAPLRPTRGNDYTEIAHVISLDLNQWSVGDTFNHVIYREAQPNADLYIDYITYQIVDAAVPVPIGGGVVDLEARSSIAELIELLQRRGDMA